MNRSTLKEITVKQIMKWKPCAEYTRKIVEKLWAGRKSLAPLEIAALDIPAKDRLWVLLRNEIIPEKKLHLLACDFADDALASVKNPDPRSLVAIQAKRDWVAGKITDRELEIARVAARKAAWEVAWEAARRAAWGAAWEAAWEEVRGAQMKRVIKVLEEASDED